jgi:hypothetical protein
MASIVQINGQDIYATSAGYAASAGIATNATSSSYALTAQTLLGSVTSASFASTASYVQNAQSASYVLNAVSASFSSTASYVGPTLNQNLTISGTLTVSNLNAITSSIQYITSSQLDISTNLIKLNTTAPLRYGGIAVVDSGSSQLLSGSLLFDSQNNQWIYVHQSAPAAAITSSILIMGPQTFNNVGNEIPIGANQLTKGGGGDLGEHITSSNITDTGTLVSINSNTEITGSLRGQVSALSIASNTASVNLSTNNFFTLALINGANTHINPTNINPGQTVNIRVTQGNAGTGTVSFPSLVDQASGSLYTGSAVANAIDIVTMITFDSSTVFISSIRNMI